MMALPAKGICGLIVVFSMFLVVHVKAQADDSSTIAVKKIKDFFIYSKK